jgi:hypothetical protein
MQPETSAETLWLTFSLLLLEPVRQVQVLGGLPSRANADERALLENGASHLLSAIQQLHAAGSTSSIRARLRASYSTLPGR